MKIATLCAFLSVLISTSRSSFSCVNVEYSNGHYFDFSELSKLEFINEGFRDQGSRLS